MNVLFVFADQMHAFAMGCMGTPDILTPNLDALAREGVLFTGAYTNCPVCTPFRANLFTGRYANQTGVFRNSLRIPAGERTLAACLNEGGYRTSYVGKWHLGGKGNIPIPRELQGDFTHFIGYQCYNQYLCDVVFYDEEGCAKTYDTHRTDVTTDLAIERLKELGDGPFALFVSYQNPHYPEQPSAGFEALYAGKELRRRPNSEAIDPYTQTFSPPSPKPEETDPVQQRYGGDLSEYLRLYYGMVSQMDAGIGRLLEALDQLGLRENTTVIFTSDHGDMQGSHGLKNKSLPWEESSRIPLIVRAPGGPSGILTDALVSGIDFFPTCLDLAELPPEPRVAGQSFAPLLRGEDQRLDGPVFSEMNGGKEQWSMVRKAEHKLVVTRESRQPIHLFNLKTDPYEMKNLVNESDHAAIIADLLRTLGEWEAECARTR